MGLMITNHPQSSEPTSLTSRAAHEPRTSHRATLPGFLFIESKRTDEYANPYTPTKFGCRNHQINVKVHETTCQKGFVTSLLPYLPYSPHIPRNDVRGDHRTEPQKRKGLVNLSFWERQRPMGIQCIPMPSKFLGQGLQGPRSADS